ncbi:hypothetical protein D9619_013135 [Psilocybe cf. subviscida]|uniref:Uncharacterized protein n=1 Tax=Psilocybe cf. subviscida TaxID=2480587 RepID=A0A8H5B6L3_9AGAR|nr:hypothetical protein D9619_013135 [Psilocybe cf. subviscida]
MPSKRQAVKAESPEPELAGGDFSDEDFAEFLGESQHSSGSDELYQQQLRETLEKLQAAERAKKREQKEKKFLELADKQLKQGITTPAQDLRTTMKKIEQIYQKFLVDHAAVEDSIYKKLDRIAEEENKLKQLIQDRQQQDEEEIKKAGTMHIDGLSKMRTACLASEKIKDKLVMSPEKTEK